LFLVTTKLKKKKITKFKPKKQVLLKSKESSKPVLLKREKELPINTPINRLKRIMKLIGLDFPKKLASIVSFVIFAT
jgi:hypothetical protein|tara:strand:+ start:57 stop:287 length:231 start_codon:yes stop_codon:yes gene_type:complete